MATRQARQSWSASRKPRSTHVTTLIGVLGVTTSSDRSVRGDAAVDRPDGAEGVDVDLEVGERLAGAWLEGSSITSCSRIERVDGREDSVRIPP